MEGGSEFSELLYFLREIVRIINKLKKKTLFMIFDKVIYVSGYYDRKIVE